MDRDSHIFCVSNVYDISIFLDINFLNYFQEETLYMDRDSQIKAIEKTFEDNKKQIERHYSKPNVVPIEVLPVYPDFKVLKIATVIILYKP